MAYVVGEEVHTTKTALTERCRRILASTPDRQPVTEADAEFLFALFQYHDEWSHKASGGVSEISTQTTVHGTRCFVLRKHSGEQVDVSFPHAIRLIPSSRTTELQPQALRDFRSAARAAVRVQIYAFRDQALQQAQSCPITGEQLTRDNVAVDHSPPGTFDQLLFEYCRERCINPLTVSVGSEGGVVAVFDDPTLTQDWQSYHERLARLRLLSRLGNLQLPKSSVPWQDLWA
jgi:hypothetical protein